MVGADGLGSGTEVNRGPGLSGLERSSVTRFLIIPRALRYSSSKRACDSDGRPWPPTHRAISASGTASLVAVCSRVLRRRRSVLVSSAPKARNSAGLTAETSDGYSLVSAEE